MSLVMVFVLTSLLAHASESPRTELEGELQNFSQFQIPGFENASFRVESFRLEEALDPTLIARLKDYRQKGAILRMEIEALSSENPPLEKRDPSLSTVQAYNAAVLQLAPNIVHPLRPTEVLEFLVPYRTFKEGDAQGDIDEVRAFQDFLNWVYTQGQRLPSRLEISVARMLNAVNTLDQFRIALRLYEEGYGVRVQFGDVRLLLPSDADVNIVKNRFTLWVPRADSNPEEIVTLYGPADVLWHHLRERRIFPRLWPHPVFLIEERFPRPIGFANCAPLFQ